MENARLKREREAVCFAPPLPIGSFAMRVSVCLFFILLCVSVSDTVPRDSLAPVAVPVSETARPPVSPPIDTLQAFQQSDFYRTIIDNNLFRPLGWTPPRVRELYRLIGTILPRDENTPSRGILQTTAGNKTYSVTIGENLDTHTEVVDIQPKQVTLATDGKQRTLKLPIRF